MFNSIFDYFEDIYDTQGEEARNAEEARVWNMYKNDPEAFNAFIKENEIDLDAYAPYEYTFTEFEYWCDVMEG